MSFKALRRSRDAKASAISPPVSANPLLSRPPSAKTFTPKKVIRAIDSRRTTNPQELSFSAGDFFYVVSEIQLVNGEWYEAHNPVTGSRGLVPAAAFEELSKHHGASNPPSQTTLSTSAPFPQPLHSVPPIGAPPIKRKHQTFYAIVQFDFVAERQDELDAKAGEPISVVAQSNREWFVAKPIGRLGGPGLIPAAFVELRDPATGQQMSEEEVASVMDRGLLPRVDEWKKATMEYKASSIPLGVIETTQPVPYSPYAPNGSFAQAQSTHSKASLSPPVSAHSQPHAEAQAQEEEILPPGILTSASIPSFHRESGEYWFRLNVEFQPDPVMESSLYPLPLSMVLYRNYDDFYAFQLELLDTYPVEAGRKKRDPYGPQLTEDDRILPYMPGPVGHVDDAVTAGRQHDLDIYVRELVQLALPHNGAEHILRSELLRRFLAQKPGDIIFPSPKHSGNSAKTVQSSGDIYRGVENLKLEDEGYAENPSPDRGSHYSDDRGNGEATEMYPNSNVVTQHRNSSSSYAPSHISHPRSAIPSHGRSPTASSIALDGPGGQTFPAFLKVKIFHSSTDDLIAIRVSPRVTYQQLLSKVRDRLGADVTELKYRNERSATRGEKGLTSIHGDNELKEWVARNSKLVLYAS
ncbi:uncharacterized protein EI90DRAFT_3129928 [Cantharellus anzutake]|uniref:uncharacterized protein n=1 Tax=Cantharellus anzutake TaxID=1750568 RepID=UPI0019067E19|nr:uncharacterized protein EI90DRAFT_3129928 [Cantharellus anzutake]KAF8324463.1 hypothetical protein EI90DRAFT_3129928 [Cantharellus anzutake]